jgi:hypothetical protein
MKAAITKAAAERARQIARDLAEDPHVRGPDSRFKKRSGFLTLTGEPENRDDKSGLASSHPW